MRMSENGSSFELCSIVNLILGCRFCSRLSNSFMYKYFPNMKQSSKYIFHDLVNSPFILLPYFFYLTSKYAKVRVLCAGTILVPIAVSRVWM